MTDGVLYRYDCKLLCDKGLAKEMLSREICSLAWLLPFPCNAGKSVWRMVLKQKKLPRNSATFPCLGGERGIRTPGASQHGGFQDRCNRPLYHLSLGDVLPEFQVEDVFRFEIECKSTDFF